jgi:hypothetical protein
VQLVPSATGAASCAPAAGVADWPGARVVVSHDLVLLESLDATAAVHDSRLTTVDRPYSASVAHLARRCGTPLAHLHSG